jgi:LPS sulfotransferase NodH
MPAMEPVYDHEFISGLEELLVEGERGWRELCAELDVTPLKIVYEDLTDPATYAEVIRSALGHLGIHGNEIPIPQPRTHRQADKINHDWVQRYTTD